MPRNKKRKQRAKIGLAPGTPVYTGDLVDRGLKVWVIDYDADTIEEHEPQDLAALAALRDTNTVTWINVAGLGDVDAIQQVCDAFGVHPLAVEDIANVHGRTKAEEYPDQLFMVLKMVTLRSTDAHDNHPVVHAEHVAIAAGPQFVLTFQESLDDVFEPVRSRLRAGRPRLRGSGTDYLAYALMDAVVDHLFVVVEQLAAASDTLEDDLLRRVDEGHLSRIYVLRREWMALRRLVWPLRDAMINITRADEIAETTRPFLRDLQDHILHVLDSIESYRDNVMGMVDLHMTGVSNQTNDVMRLLTVVGSIFIPLTFIAGVYGMNFEHMPELHWDYGYATVWAVMIVTTAAMVGYFRRKGWL